MIITYTYAGKPHRLEYWNSDERETVLASIPAGAENVVFTSAF